MSILCETCKCNRPCGECKELECKKIERERKEKKMQKLDAETLKEIFTLMAAIRLNTLGIDSTCPYCEKTHNFIVKENNEWRIECPSYHARSDRANTLKAAVKNLEILY